MWRHLGDPVVLDWAAPVHLSSVHGLWAHLWQSPRRYYKHNPLDHLSKATVLLRVTIYLKTYLSSNNLSAIQMSTEATAAIIFGILQVGISLVALWQQHHLQQERRRQRMLSLAADPFTKLTCYQD